MRLNISQKILAGYLAGFILLLGFAALTFVNGKRIEATTVTLAENKLPGLIAINNLKDGFQTQKSHLYEFYATADRAAFEKRYQQDMADMQKQLQDASALPEFHDYEAALHGMIENQRAITQKFSAAITAQEVDWDRVRSVLGEFSASTDAAKQLLDKLVQSVSDETLTLAGTSGQLINQLMTGSLILALIVFLGVVAMAYLTTRFVTSPFKAMSQSLGEIASTRDLTRRLDRRSDDEVGDIANAVNHLLAEFQQLASTLDRTAQGLGATVNSLSRVADTTTKAVLQQNVQIQAIDTGAKDIAAKVDLIANKAGMAAERAGSSAKASQQGREVVANSRNSIASLAEEVQSTANVILQLEEDSRKVTNVLSMIRDIADQTNLLALNAAIEAARAGEAGRGFAVVADEVRKLSQSTSGATTEIDQIMASLRNMAQEAAELMQQAHAHADTSVEVAREAETRLQEIQESAQHIYMVNSEIDVVTRDHQLEVQAIRGRVAEIEGGAAANQSHVEVLNTTTREIAAIAENLRSQISMIRF